MEHLHAHHAAKSLPDPLLDSILEHSAEGIVVLDASGRVQECNPAAVRLCGRTARDLIGRHWASLRLESAPDAGSNDVEHEPDLGLDVGGLDGPPQRSTAHHVLRDADGRPVATLVFIREAGDGERVADDVAARERALAEALKALRSSHEQLKSTQLQLIQAARLESVGRLAAGVAHEVKNPLAILLTGIQLMQRRTRDADTLALLGDLEIAVRRANGVVVGLLDFSASIELKLESIELENVVSDALRLVHHELDARRVRFRWDKATPMPRLKVDRMKIEQVIVNLMMNAMDAMPAGGELVLRTSVRQLTRTGHGVGYRKSDRLRLGQTVAVFEVEDGGTGIPPDIFWRAFEPFFTTKPAGKGTGLGLAVCRMIAELHRGSVWLENRPEGGARATLWLPAGETRKGEST